MRVCIYYIYRIFFRIFVKKLVYSILKLPMPPIILYSICTVSVNWIRQELLNWSNLLKAIELQMTSLLLFGGKEES